VAHNLKVVGSNPAPATKLINLSRVFSKRPKNLGAALVPHLIEKVPRVFSQLPHEEMMPRTIVDAPFSLKVIDINVGRKDDVLRFFMR